MFQANISEGQEIWKNATQNIPVGGEISDLTVSVKKRGGGTICTVQYNKELRAHLILHIFLLHGLPVIQNFSLLNLYLHNTSSQPNNKMWFGSQKNVFYLCTDSLKKTPLLPNSCLRTPHKSLSVHSFISIQPQRPGWQEPEPSHVTDMALAHCILGNSWGQFAITFPRLQTFPLVAARCLYVRNDARDPSSERWNYVGEKHGR